MRPTVVSGWELLRLRALLRVGLDYVEALAPIPQDDGVGLSSIQ